MKQKTASIALLAGATAIVNVVDTAGNEEPQQGALYENGWVVANHEGAAIMDAYLGFREIASRAGVGL